MLNKYNGSPGSVNFGSKIASIKLQRLPKSIILNENFTAG